MKEEKSTTNNKTTEKVAAEKATPADDAKAKADTKTKESNTNTDEPKNLVITVPDDLGIEAFDRLEALISSKKSLLEKALGCKEAKVIRKDEKLEFPWFTLQGIDGETEAYTLLVEAMVKMAKEATRIDSHEKEVTNEKFTMRNFTIRLGLKGDKYKLLRKLLSTHLTGNSAWKDGAPPKKADEKKAKDETAIAEKKAADSKATTNNDDAKSSNKTGKK